MADIYAFPEDDTWYPPEDCYYVSRPSAEEYPTRQGDLFPAPPGLVDMDGEQWLACQVTSPSCEMVKRRPILLQVICVKDLANVDDKLQEEVVRGWQRKNGVVTIARANTFFLPPVANLEGPMYSDFQEVALVPREQLAVENRIAAMSHDARVLFVRRKIYWEQRWRLLKSDVVQLESARIGRDPTFRGPRPDWAPLITS